MAIRHSDLSWIKSCFGDGVQGKTWAISELAGWYAGNAKELWDYAVKGKYIEKVEDSRAFDGLWKATPKLKNLKIVSPFS